MDDSFVRLCWRLQNSWNHRLIAVPIADLPSKNRLLPVINYFKKTAPTATVKPWGLESQAESDFPLLRCIDFVQEEVDRAYLDTDASDEVVDVQVGPVVPRGARWVGLPMLPGWGLESTYLKERFKWNCWPIFFAHFDELRVCCKFFFLVAFIEMSGGLAGFLYHQQKESTSLKNIPVATRILLPELIFDAFFMSGVLPGI